MTKFTTRLFVALAVSSLLTVSALAQGTARGRYYSKGEVEKIIKRVEDRSDAFQKMVDRNLDRSYLDGTRKEDNINEQVKQLEKALDHLRSDFDRRDSWRETHNEVRAVLSQADEVGRIMKNNRFNPKVERSWVALRTDLNTLAGVYDLPRLRY
jgi:Skp family chaperone for outer membrane proteins